MEIDEVQSVKVEDFERVSFEAQCMCGGNFAGLHTRAPLVCNAASRKKHIAGSVTPAACDVVWLERHSVGSVTALDKHGWFDQRFQKFYRQCHHT